MSHFAVLVIGPDVEEQLAPFDENIQAEPRWEDTDWPNAESVGLPDTATAQEIIDGYAAKYGPLEDGERYRVGENGQLQQQTTYNPISKWDWYSVGGRWQGFFKLKAGAKGQMGESGAFGNEPLHINGADVVTKADVDFEGMREQARREANETYDRYESAVAGTEPVLGWSKFMQEQEAEGKQIDEIRTLYHAQPRVQALHAADLMPWFKDVDDVYGVGREAFVERAAQRVGIPYALVHNGEWYAKGEMGWWGMSTDTHEEDEWNEKVSELYDALPDDTILTLVDCHI